MFTIDINKPIHIHFIGIGGISMSGLAELLHAKGFTISGSDWNTTDLTRRLAEQGMTIYRGQRASNITDDIDLVVYTAAVHEDNPEYMACVEKHLPMMDRAELLGQISHAYPVSIGVAGTHGKTTTTSMISLMLVEAGLDPTISLGGMLNAIGGNLRIGNSENFLFEACEYTNSFLKFYPTDEVILNIDADHLDFFKDLDDIRHSFHLFAERLPANGHLIINGEIPELAEFLCGLHGTVDTYGILPEGIDPKNSPYRFTATNIAYDDHGCASYDFYLDGEYIDRIALSVIGRHNVSNSLAAIAEGYLRGIGMEHMKRALLAFTGTGRRFEVKGVLGGITIVDDYAHHPTEIAATLTSAQAYPHNTLWCVFQPHTYSRTIKLREDFVRALSNADKIVLADIYAAREVNTGEISSKDLCEDLRKMGKDAYYFPSFDEIENFLINNCTNGDLLITMGAGDIVKVGETLLGK